MDATGDRIKQNKPYPESKNGFHYHLWIVDFADIKRSCMCILCIYMILYARVYTNMYVIYVYVNMKCIHIFI